MIDLFKPYDGTIENLNENDGRIDVYGQGFKKYVAPGWYKTVEFPNDWKKCPKCGLKPIVWEYDNGRSTACGCGLSKYGHFSVHAESINHSVKAHDGSAAYYDVHELQNNWNSYCESGIVPDDNRKKSTNQHGQ